jgi:hypothetical protein
VQHTEARKERERKSSLQTLGWFPSTQNRRRSDRNKINGRENRREC